MFETCAHRLLLLWGWPRRLVTFVAGALSALALAPVHAGPILFLTLPVLVVLIDGAVVAGPRGVRRLRPAAATGWWFGFGYFFAGLHWVGLAFLAEGRSALVPLMPFAVASLAAGLALFTALGTLIARLLWSDGPTRIFALAIGLGASEWLRGHVLTGFPWNLLGQAVAFTDITAQGASVVGIYGLTLAGIAVFAAPALLADARDQRPWPRRLTLALALLIAAADVGWGFYRLSGAAPVGEAVMADARIRIVQPNIDQAAKWSPEKKQEALYKLTSLSDRRTDPETLGAISFSEIVWPETALPFFLTEEPEALARIADLLSPGTILLTGAPRVEPADDLGDGGRRYYNSLFAIDDTGAIRAAYDKVHLVPFGEYMPFGALVRRLGIGELFRGIGGFSPGPRRNLIAIPGHPSFSVLICYEAIFPGEVLPEGGRPDYLVNITNDGWFGRSSGPHQHLDAARMRAIEEGLPVVRAANTGISAIVDAYGRTVASLPLGEEGVLDGFVPSERPKTFFQHGQPTFLLAFNIFFILLALFGKRKRRTGS
ncbi:apolipoprotein N-acyltransferase [Pleomorphomonas carboxyditropha]|uniref:Apolipoprotein N-acyltransferase n=1 Tax=Pleomorphomonas carboxyditropha TaxID=2023338 RepID=A0A2G9X018_9HYPH|nr:apolipoprotein N-acyltransferase [Pleomorphomonas carboxyditropha]PIO99932.1 apolipoprotein N-acyltransferase [Pleomorphomonas carboxyditropha]